MLRRNRRFSLRALILIVVSLCLMTGGAVRAQTPCMGLDDCLQDLKSSDATARSGAIFMLGNLKDKRATPALVELFKEARDPGVRLSAIKAIGSLKDPAAVPVLTESLEDKDLQQDAVRALVKIANKPAVLALIRGLKNEDVRTAAAQGLGEIADPSAKEPLLKLFHETADERVKGVSALAIQRINSIWGPSEREMGVPWYPKAEFIPNTRGEWVFISKDPLERVSDFFKKHLKKSPLSFPAFKKRYENGFTETQEGVPANQPGLIFVAQEQEFQGRKYPAKLIFLQVSQKETEIKIFNAAGAPD
ncbi:MAG: HEAT repeat domain-containing protein [Nitrospirae bacterium]|nr:HEAT repeat domain-containing protein [Nitrospirota bacterium]